MTNKEIFDSLMDTVGNAYGVCGLMGNMKKESGLKPNNMQNSYEAKLGMNDATYTAMVDSGAYGNFVFDSVGYGYCQWTSSGRKNNLLNFAKATDASIGNPKMQVDFIKQELNGSYKNVLKVLQNAKSIREASDYVLKHYERPADQGEAEQIKRATYGEELYRELVGEQEEENMNVYKKGVKVQLSKNFKSTEFDCNGKGCCTSTPIDPKLVEVLQNIRDHFGASVDLNCGYRCPAHNAKVSGASTNSKHMSGIAADIVVKDGAVHPMRVARYIESIPGFAGRIGCYSWDDKGNGFVHVDVRGVNSRAIYTDNNRDYDSLTKFNTSVKRGSKGRLVKVVQRKLRAAGLYWGLIDGKCGRGTEKAIIKWNAKYGRENDKSWGPKCWNEAFPI